MATLSRASSRIPLWSASRSVARTVITNNAIARTPALAALARYYASKSYPPHTIISMPALSPTMTSGNIGAWQKKAGDSLSPGDVLVEIETDKAQMDFEFQEEGVLAKILKESGEKDVAVGSPIAVMVEEGEDISAFESFTVEDAGGDKAPPKEKPSAEATESSDPPKSTPKKSESAPAAAESESTGGRLETALSRFRKQPKEAAKSGAAPAATSAAPAAATYVDEEPSSMRKTIAKRLQQSMNENPHYFVTSAVSVTKLLKLRAALNASANGAYKLSVNDFLIKACAVALAKVPAVNSAWIEQGGKAVIRRYTVADISVAVATPSGLMTPIIKNVGGIGLASISAQVKDLGKRARDGKLKPDEYQGGTFTISNMGMNDAVDRFTAVINPPQAAILAVGTTKKVAIPAEGEEGGVEWDDQIVLQCSFDHKVIDGAVGAEFMKELKKVVENPLELLL
ncbi:pyruvate dehydrogenase complex dihydrolipoamide acetyltransferase [Verruconis gallopava]|uniref:Dihydrolipoamide acetyltransferase component of pyruvate dehydrogenase complex n=1 Tax=Verruconis gallopava TaxID=253628 RepID=A0A0D2APS4_9PEZI|nr:pyruvate dehydrogenase complex dihydrolipoamide acetyltransferase [Verruconis gallopava]KIW08698.1 pyruvate dehydrogenase complex dihydrolipoamide acetyltransferase [Verruconis gallopava]